MFETIKNEAEKKGLSISELERRAGMARGALYKWKECSPNLDTLDRVAEALGLETSTLIARAKKK